MTKWRDDWYFDWGYFLPYCLTIMFMCLLFSVLMPVTTFFGLIFFMFRFQVEKYNMLYVFVKDFDSHSEIHNYVTNYFIMTVFLF